MIGVSSLRGEEVSFPHTTDVDELVDGRLVSRVVPGHRHGLVSVVSELCRGRLACQSPRCVESF